MSASTSHGPEPAVINSFAFLNIQGLCPQTVPSKVPFISSTLCSSNCLFVGLSETWLKSQLEAELKIDGFSLFRTDTKRKQKARGRHTGGVGMYVRDDIACSSEIIFSHASECVQMMCLYSQIENLAVLIVYRQPDDKYNGNPSTPNDFIIPLNRAKTILSTLQPMPDIIVGGDFNLPHASWPEGLPKSGATVSERQMLNALNEFSNELYLSQIVTKPTHKDGNILDLVFVNNQSLIHDCTNIPVLQSTSHHYIVEVSTPYKVKTCNTSSNEKAPRTMFNTLNFFSDDINWETVNEKIGNINWKDKFKDMDADGTLEALYSLIFDICKDHVPQRNETEIKQGTKVERYRKALIKRRRKLKKQLVNAKSAARVSKIHQELLDVEKNLQKSFKASALYNEDKAVKAIKKNAKYFYAYVKKKAKVLSKIGPLLNLEGALTNNNKEMAEILSKQYAKVFSTPKEAHQDARAPSGPTIESIEVRKEDLEAAIDELSSNAAAGPDGFPAILLKNCKEVISTPLSLLWNTSLQSGVVPEKLKRAIITPIYKGGGTSKSQAVNYRPIALTSHLVKLFEKVLRKYLIEHMNKNNLFNENQHGFRQGRSCLSQLIEQYDLILSLLDREANVDVVYLDFSKAFDKVDHQIVLRKIEAMGINGNILQWIKSFLTQRYQSVSVNGVLSDPQEVISGVPQGSVLGPLIFLILISDIDADVIDSIVKSFADDTRATKGVWSVDDAAKLQEDLQRIYEWTEDNNMKLNDVKFELLRCGLNTLLKELTSYTTPSGTLIEEKKDVKDLGIFMSNDCSFRKQINIAIEKSKSVIMWILRSFQTREASPLITLYKVLVIPLLEYCSVLWSPSSKGQIQSLESVQWSFLRKIRGDNHDDYWACLKKMQVYSLERRRERYRIIYIWKILENLVPNPNGQVNSSTHIRLGRFCSVPKPLHTRKWQKEFEASLPVQGARLFNAMPKQIREMTNTPLLNFKRALDKYLALVPDEPLLPSYTVFRRADTNSIVHMQKFAKSAAAPNSFQEQHSAGGELLDLQA